METNHKFTFRWSIKQTGEREVEMLVPRGPNGASILNPEFVEMQHLSDAEIDVAEDAVIREIAIVK